MGTAQRSGRGRSGRAKAGSPRGERVGGTLTFSRSVYGEIAARVLRDVRDVKQVAGDIVSGLIGRLTRGVSHPGIQVEDREDGVAFQVSVIARHGANFYDLGLEIQRKIAERVRDMTGRPCTVNVNVKGVSL